MRKHIAITTNIKQSERLKAIGIDPMTADMMWTFTKSPSPTLAICSNNLKQKTMDLLYQYDILPAWTLDNLIDILPQKIDNTVLVIHPITYQKKDAWMVSYMKDSGSCMYVHYGEFKFLTQAETKMDAVLNMIRLLKLNKVF